MTKIKIMRSFVAAVLIAVCFACTNSDDDAASNNGGDTINVEELTVISTTGTWRISSYVEEGNNETNHFTNYTFTFKQDGTVTAVNAESTINGTWSISDDDDDDDDNPSTDSDKDFVLNFNVGEDEDFDDLNDDWDIENYTANKISLIDISGGNGGTDKLVFEKN
ncbi:hypothetical protein LZ575_19785 [Antarcticibacterium sp. 1MA-6-2]|uniref:hypothetical protein n=1 Tax=Antarcticibacterium sp. 1MA-6-2 TaxID=2908210 RepID=UPI001F19258C|nr:hypothetical protein [Antarcticibacterium sp. 1MA-6-2]UJH90914.1 hypothetical protein LZ575_19785 [Antarcticibacterium sp. 1MA-6-2]